MNISFYLLVKSTDETVTEHPCLKTILILKGMMEKLTDFKVLKTTESKHKQENVLVKECKIKNVSEKKGKIQSKDNHIEKCVKNIEEISESEASEYSDEFVTADEKTPIKTIRKKTIIADLESKISILPIIKKIKRQEKKEILPSDLFQELLNLDAENEVKRNTKTGINKHIQKIDKVSLTYQ